MDWADESDEAGRVWPWVLDGLAAVAMTIGVFWFLARPQDTRATPEPLPPLVTAAEVVPVSRLTLEQTGFVRARAQVEVVAQIGGRIAEIGERFELGARLSGGDLLFRLEEASFQADLEQARANVEQARAAVTEARIARQRREELEDRDFASEAALQGAILKEVRAEAELASARAQLTRAENALDDTTVTAPFDAVVVAESAAPGQLVQPGTSVGRIVGADSVEIEMGLLPSELDLLGQAERALGAEMAILSPESGTRLASGVVTGVVPAIERTTRTVGLVVAVRDPFASDPGRPLRIGELVRLSLPVEAASGAVGLPAEAVKGRNLAWRVSEGALERLSVEVLHRGEERVVQRAGALQPGDLVMLSDLAAAFDDKRVRLERDQSSQTGSPSAPKGG